MIRCSCEKCGSAVVSLTQAGVCPACGTTVLPRLSASCHSEPRSRAGIPWENLGNYSFWSALRSTLAESLFSPVHFFDRLKSSSATGPAFLFALTMGSIQAVLGFFWSQIQTSSAFSLSSGMFSEQFGPTTLLFTPIMTAVSVSLFAVYVHVLLTLTGSRHRGFSSTFQTICYVQSASIFSLLPVIGSFIAAIWGIALTIIGLSRVHDISRLRTVLVLLVPMVISFLLIAGLIAAALLGGILSSEFFRDILSLYRYN